MHDEDTLDDVEELLRDVHERRSMGQGPSGGEAAGDERSDSTVPADNETIAVGPQSVGETGETSASGWATPDDEETIDVDPEVLKELRSAPAAGVLDEDETVVADVSRLAASQVAESVSGPPEAHLGAPRSFPGRRVPLWAWMAGSLLAVAILVVVALRAGWWPTSGDDDTEDGQAAVSVPEGEDDGTQAESAPMLEEPKINDPASESGGLVVGQGPEATGSASSGEGVDATAGRVDWDFSALGSSTLPGEGVDVTAGRVDWDFSALGSSTLPGEGVDVTAGPAVPPLSDGPFQAELYEQLLKELGYNVSYPRSVQLVRDGYIALAQDEVDYWPNSWYPHHRSWLEAELPDGSLVGDHVTVVGKQLIEGGLQGFLITKSFADEYGVYTMDEFNRNAEALAAFDANDVVPGNGMADIFGCPGDWVCNRIIENQIVFSGWDNLQQLDSAYWAMYATAVNDVRLDEPIVLYAWTPSTLTSQLRPGDNVYWLGVERILDDSNPANQEGGEEHDQRGTGGMGGFAAINADQCPSVVDEPSGRCKIGWIVSDILVTANNNFLEENPAARALFEAVKLSVFDLSLAHAAIVEGARPSDVAAQWISDNRDQVDEWIGAALSAV